MSKNEPAALRLYDYQQHMNRLASRGENLIVQAPTGAGKTLGALFPGLSSFRKSSAEHPQKIVYGVPMRVLGRSFQAEYTRFIQQYSDLRTNYSWYPRIQMGEQADDPLFEGRLIFATVDQMLASFLHMPYGIPRRLDNINAGAFIGSYLIFDEFHLYPSQEMMLTVLAMLKMLAGISRFTLMSATFSKPFLDAIAHELGAQVIADELDTPSAQSWFKDVPSLQTQHRRWFAHEGALDASAMRPHLGQRNLAICNTVERAQMLYASARDAFPDVECRLLHSRFYKEDRRRIEDWVLANYGKAESRTPEQAAWHSDKPCLLIATQVIEVGLDISSDVMFSECAPASSLIQRAGRCARRQGEHGELHVYQPFDADGQVNYAPYGGTKADEGDAGIEAVCHKTWETLTASAFNQQVLRFAEEQALINTAHGAHDQHMIAGLSNKLNRRIAEITECISQKSDGLLGDLIRKQTSVPLYIRANLNDERLTERPRQLESLNLSRGQIRRLWDSANATTCQADFFIAGCSGVAEDGVTEDGMSQERFQWQALRTGGEVYQAGYSWFVAHPQAIAYDDAFGLRLEPAEQPAPESPELMGSGYMREPYIADRYHEHISGLWYAYTRPFEPLLSFSVQEGYQFRRGDKLYMPLRDEIAYGLRRLCERVGKDPDHAERLIRLVLAVHDVGKLNRPWQAWAQGWQAQRLQQGFEVTIEPHDGPFAHTDYDPRQAEQVALYKDFKAQARGTHAVEGAEACLPLLWETCRKDGFFLDVVLSAIMHHHTPSACECGMFEMIAEGRAAIHKALDVCGFREGVEQMTEGVKAQFSQNGRRIADAAKQIQPSEFAYNKNFVYALFVRVLRLADQRSGDYWRKYGVDDI